MPDASEVQIVVIFCVFVHVPEALWLEFSVSVGFFLQQNVKFQMETEEGESLIQFPLLFLHFSLEQRFKKYYYDSPLASN